MRKPELGDLVRLKPAHIIRTQKESDLDDDEHYNPDDWVGVIVGFPGFETKQSANQMKLFETCLVMWKGRTPVGEFIDHLEILQ